MGGNYELNRIVNQNTYRPVSLPQAGGLVMSAIKSSCPLPSRMREIKSLGWTNVAHARYQTTDQGSLRARAMLAQTPNHDLFSQE
jgi:hypothetical protein